MKKINFFELKTENNIHNIYINIFITCHVKRECNNNKCLFNNKTDIEYVFVYGKIQGESKEKKKR